MLRIAVATVGVSAAIASFVGVMYLRYANDTIGAPVPSCCGGVVVRAYLDRRVAEGKSRREGMRALKRFVVRAIWRLWLQCNSAPALPLATAA